jgi:ornithine cyclodeaminase
MAFGALGDVDTGAPVLLRNDPDHRDPHRRHLALAARYLARKDSKRMALIGNGSQSEFQAMAFHTLLGIDEIRLFDIDRAATGKLGGQPPATGNQVTIAGSVADAVQARHRHHGHRRQGLRHHPHPEMIEPGMHLNAVGGDCPGKTELHREIVERARVIVEYEPQSRIEGEIQQMPPDSPTTEFWQVVKGQRPGRESAEQVTCSTRSVCHRRLLGAALRAGCGQGAGRGHDINLVPDLANPKDLFALLAQPPARSRKSAPETALAAALRPGQAGFRRMKTIQRVQQPIPHALCSAIRALSAEANDTKNAPPRAF